MEKKDVIWLSWDRHRRTVELSQSIGVPPAGDSLQPLWVAPSVVASRQVVGSR